MGGPPRTILPTHRPQPEASVQTLYSDPRSRHSARSFCPGILPRAAEQAEAGVHDEWAAAGSKASPAHV